MTRRPYQFGLLGYRISYTLSPQIFSRLFDRYGLAGQFFVIDLLPEKIKSKINRLKDLDAFSVTIPYKERIIPFLDELSGPAKEIAAINAVKVESGKLIGFNTDGEGFLYPLVKSGSCPQTILIMGAGGGARAVAAAALHRYPLLTITICARDKTKAATIVSFLKSMCCRGQEVVATGFSQIKNDDQFDLIVNATPVGGMSMPKQSLLPRGFEFRNCRLCYDLNYHPPITVLLEQAAKRGCQTVNGLPMLAAQAAASFKIWTGIEADISDIETTLLCAGGKV